MPINRGKTKGTNSDEDLFVLRDPFKEYTHGEVCDLLEKAERMGISLDKGSELEGLTVKQLDNLVNVVH